MAGTRPATSHDEMLTADRRPTAIFTASDTQALGVIAAARELGLHVPDDLSVIGYDDVEAADYVGLTTVRQQLFESGRRGAELLLAEIAAPGPNSRRSFTWHRSWWSARPRRLRRRAVASDRPDDLAPVKEHPRGGPCS